MTMRTLTTLALVALAGCMTPSMGRQLAEDLDRLEALLAEDVPTLQEFKNRALEMQIDKAAFIGTVAYNLENQGRNQERKDNNVLKRVLINERRLNEIAVRNKGQVGAFLDYINSLPMGVNP